MFPPVQRWIDEKHTTSRTSKVVRTSTALLCLSFHELFPKEMRTCQGTYVVNPNRSTSHQRTRTLRIHTVCSVVWNLSGGTLMPQPGRMYDPADFGNISGHCVRRRGSRLCIPGQEFCGHGEQKNDW